MGAIVPQTEAFLGAHAREIVDHHEARCGEAPHPGIDLVEIDCVHPRLAADPALDCDVQRCADADRDVSGFAGVNDRCADAERRREVLCSHSCAAILEHVSRQRPTALSQAVQVLRPPLHVAGLTAVTDRVGHGGPPLHGLQNVVTAVDQPDTPHQEPRHRLGVDRVRRVLDLRLLSAARIRDRRLGISGCGMPIPSSGGR